MQKKSSRTGRIFYCTLPEMKKLFFTIVVLSCISYASAQVRCTINKASAYFTVSVPGVQMVDDNGNPVPPVPQVERFIYLESKGAGKPVVESVSYNAVALKATTSKIMSSTVSVGKKQDTQQPIIFKAKKGNSIWRIDIQPTDDKPQDVNACKNILLKIKVPGKTCTYRITGGEYQLYTLPRY